MASSQNDALYNILTLNVRGLRNDINRKTRLQWPRNNEFKADIIFLQETYVDKQLKTKIDNEYNAVDLHAFTESNYSRGVSYFISEKLEAKTISFHSSDDGRILLINLSVKGELITLVNIYAPNISKDRINCFKNICNKA